MSILNPLGLNSSRQLLASKIKDAFCKQASVRMSGILQLISSGHLIVAVPNALVQGVFDAMHEPGITLASDIEVLPSKAGIVVMTPEEVEAIGGPNVITERGKPFFYTTGNVEEIPARGLAGILSCFHLMIKSPDLVTLRKAYGLSGKVDGDADLSVIVAIRKSGVLAANAKSKAVQQVDNSKLPDWIK